MAITPGGGISLFKWLTNQDALSQWNTISTMLAPSLSYDPFNVKLNDIKELIEQDWAWCGVSETEAGLEMVSVFQTVENPAGRHVSVLALAGKHPEKWLKEMFDAAEGIAEALHCKGMIFRGRQGWMKHAKQYGFKPVQTIWRREL